MRMNFLEPDTLLFVCGKPARCAARFTLESGHKVPRYLGFGNRGISPTNQCVYLKRYKPLGAAIQWKVKEIAKGWY
jgi:hypothetical protein